MSNYIEHPAAGKLGTMKVPSVDEIESVAQRCLAEDGWQPSRWFETLVGMSPESFVSEVEGGHKRKLEQRLAARFQGPVGDRMRGDLVKWLQNPTTANATEKNAMTDHVIRYVVTHINKDGMRTLCGPAQGRLTKETAEEAQALLDATMKNNRMDGELLAGVYGLPLEVRPVKCYPGHFDPMSVYFDTDDSEGEADQPIG